MTTTTRTWQVLMIDDSPHDVELVRQVLGENPTIEMHSVTNAVQAHAFLARRPPFLSAPTPDLILVDLLMPVFRGDLVLPAIRRYPRLLATKVVVLTGSTAEGDRQKCHDLGVDEYVIKPTVWSEWQRVLADIVAKHLPHEPH